MNFITVLVDDILLYTYTHILMSISRSWYVLWIELYSLMISWILTLGICEYYMIWKGTFAILFGHSGFWKDSNIQQLSSL